MKISRTISGYIGFLVGYYNYMIYMLSGLREGMGGW